MTDNYSDLVPICYCIVPIYRDYDNDSTDSMISLGKMHIVFLFLSGDYCYAYYCHGTRWAMFTLSLKDKQEESCPANRCVHGLYSLCCCHFSLVWHIY